MSSIRVPLANNPNAVNSPRRGAVASKRGRLQYEDNISPPKKRQNLGTFNGSFRRAQKISVNEPEGRVFTERRETVPQNRFQQELLRAREARQHTTQRATEITNDDPTVGPSKEQIQNWRRHYRRVFPQFVFYFDNLTSDIALKSKRMVVGLGARHEQFFSKDVTHVITTRTIPPAVAEAASKPQRATVDPSVLTKNSDRQAGKFQQKFAFTGQENGIKLPWDAKQPQQSNDVLYKARDLKIKIWALEKLERIIAAMFSIDVEDQEPLQERRATHSKVIPLKRERDADDLSQLLRNERNNAAVERKPWQEIVPFKGPYIYIHDMDERTKPVMLREYPNPIRKEEGDWPMLRSVSKGRCPFVEEPPVDRRAEQLRLKKEQAKVGQEAPRLTRAHTAPTATADERPRTRSQTRSPEKGPLRESTTTQNQLTKPTLRPTTSKGFDAPTIHRHDTGSTDIMPPLLGSTHANFRGIVRNPGGEPMASGMQRQNITSAIQSQMYSSTAPSAPGTRVGMSKQQHQMSRKVLERQSGLSGNSVPSSFNVNDVRAAINNEPAPIPRRSTRQKTADELARIFEDDENTDEDLRVHKQQLQQAAKKKAAKRDPKPGYCENCRDKYDDFQEHITGKKHKKFAMTDENWVELDALLKKLVRV